ncbi:MAG: hypothetical protein D6713_02230 [Deltaproteobacteria bacterium]|nr:MAG: hypothetical protein D6713_02230 [Deltaproteobacteria bacterium]
MKFEIPTGVLNLERLKPDVLQRFLAKVIDVVIALCLWQIPGAAGYLASVVFLLVSDTVFGDRSPGKKVAGLKVIRLDGERVDLLTSVMRNIPFAIPFAVYPVPVVGKILAVLGFLILYLGEAYFCLYGDEGLRVGDTMASTSVILDEGEE